MTDPTNETRSDVFEPSDTAAIEPFCEGHGRGPTDACAYLASKRQGNPTNEESE